MEQVTGIEPASPAWKAGTLTIVRHLHIRFFLLLYFKLLFLYLNVHYHASYFTIHDSPFYFIFDSILASLTGLEPAPYRLGGGRSIQLSYKDIY